MTVQEMLVGIACRCGRATCDRPAVVVVNRARKGWSAWCKRHYRPTPGESVQEIGWQISPNLAQMLVKESKSRK